MTSLSTDELAAVADAMTGAGVAPAAPLAARALKGGRSNLTFVLTDGQASWVLRMPPRAGRTPSAHDVAREFRVTSALSGTAVPVARPVVLVEDDSALGGPFAVAEFVTGRTVQSGADLDDLDDATVAAAIGRLVEVLAALHAVDHVAVGLERFGRPDAYFERQLARWTGQWALVAAEDVRADGEQIAARLAERVPAQRFTGIVHGDYRMDNTLLELSPGAARVAAVVDWELSTIGDPVADVAMMCAYRDPVFDYIVGEPSAWTSDRLPDAATLAGMYEAAGGVALADFETHLALAYFKVAAIAAGIDHRRRHGAASGPGFDTAANSVPRYLDLAGKLLR